MSHSNFFCSLFHSVLPFRHDHQVTTFARTLCIQNQ